MNSRGFPGSRGQTFGDDAGVDERFGAWATSGGDFVGAAGGAPRGTLSPCWRQYLQNVWYDASNGGVARRHAIQTPLTE
jgi:hypothetical protein